MEHLPAQSAAFLLGLTAQLSAQYVKDGFPSGRGAPAPPPVEALAVVTASVVPLVPDHDGMDGADDLHDERVAGLMLTALDVFMPAPPTALEALYVLMPEVPIFQPCV